MTEIKIQATIELLTPAFCAGADNINSAEIRAASIRGGLRFWARALLGYVYGNRIADIKKTESDIFGDTKEASRVTVRVNSTAIAASGNVGNTRRQAREIKDITGFSDQHIDRLTINRNGQQDVPSNSLGWLGFGCVNYRGDAERKYIKPGTSFNIEITHRAGAKVLCEKEIILLGSALWCYITFGGLGSKSRRGWGAMSFAGAPEGFGFLPENHLSKPTEGLNWILNELRRQFGDNANPAQNLPSFSHFAPGYTRVVRGAQSNGGFQSPMEALDFAGCLLIAYRRRYGVQNGNTIVHVRESDYQWAKGLQAVRPIGVPARAGFGLPLPFGKPQNMIVKVNKNNQNGNGERRATPLLLTIHKENGKYYPLFTYFKSRLLPNGTSISWKNNNNLNAPNNTQIVDDFIDFYTGNNRLAEITPEALN